MLDLVSGIALRSADHAALAAACDAGVGLCTIVGIEGSFSRRTGAQLAVLPDGSTIGSLSDGCLEAQLAADILKASKPEVIRYGAGSDTIDFRLPCGGGLDILVDPEPDRIACRQAMETLEQRAPASIALPANGLLSERRYLPSLRITAFGEGPELEYLEALSAALGIELMPYDKSVLHLGKGLSEFRADRWTACLFLFHDHEWELPLLEQALASDAFYIGAQGGENARIARILGLARRGLAEERVARIHSPLGVIPSCKTPQALALSALGEVVAHYERLHDTA